MNLTKNVVKEVVDNNSRLCPFEDTEIVEDSSPSPSTKIKRQEA